MPQFTLKKGKANADKPRKRRLSQGRRGRPRGKTLSHAAARYGILDMESGLWQFKRTTYDMRDTAQRMVQLGLW